MTLVTHLQSKTPPGISFHTWQLWQHLKPWGSKEGSKKCRLSSELDRCRSGSTCPEMPSASKTQHSKIWVSPLPFFQGDSSPKDCGSGDVPHRVVVLIRVTGSKSVCLVGHSSLRMEQEPIHPCMGRHGGGPHSLACCAGGFFTFNFFGKLYPLGICQRFLLLFNTFKIQNFADKLDHRLCLVKRCG